MRITLNEVRALVREALETSPASGNLLDKDPVYRSPDGIIASNEFKDLASQVDAALRPLYDVVTDRAAEGIMLDDFEEHIKGFSSDHVRYMCAATVKNRGFGDMKIHDVTWNDPVFGLYRIFRIANRTIDRDALITNITRVTKIIMTHLESGNDAPKESMANPDDSPFGDYVFAPDRKGQVPFEKNTDVEEKTYKALRSHILDNKPVDDETAFQLMSILSTDTYPSVIHEPSAEYVFRGLCLRESALSKILGEQPSKDGQHSRNVSTTVSARNESGNSSSWSADWEVAQNYSTVRKSDGVFSVILVARVSDNPDTFIEGPDGFYKAKSLSRYADQENETIALGSVKICKVYWSWPVKNIIKIKGEFNMDDVAKMTSEGLLRSLIRETLIKEIDIEDVGDVCYTAGSTHVMKTCKIGGDEYYLKFSDDSLFEDVDPSLQILVEYLAYRIYSLFSGINVPHPELVYDASHNKVGIATSSVKGKMALSSRIDPKLLARMMSQGVYVDVFLGNWDVIGTGSGNVFVDKDKATRIDPGGSLTFRAQGGRKGQAFGHRAKELETMLQPGSGAGNVYRHADLKVAAKEFLSVAWQQIASEIDAVNNELSTQLKERGMKKLLGQWKSDVAEIKDKLEKRYEEVAAHAKSMK